jgi:hypothetical protein
LCNAKKDPPILSDRRVFETVRRYAFFARRRRKAAIAPPMPTSVSVAGSGTGAGGTSEVLARAVWILSVSLPPRPVNGST